MNDHLDGIATRIREAAAPPEGLREQVDTLREELDRAGRDLTDFGRGASTWGTIQRATNLPTADQLWQIDRSWEHLPAVIERLNTLLADRLPPPIRKGAGPKNCGPSWTRRW